MEKEANRNILDLDSSATNLVAIILALNVVVGVVYLVLQYLANLYEYKQLIALFGSQTRTITRGMATIILDSLLAYYIYKRKTLARDLIIMQATLGAIAWTIVGLINRDIFQSLFQVFFSGTLLALLTNKIKLKITKIFAYVLIVLLLLLFILLAISIVLFYFKMR